MEIVTAGKITRQYFVRGMTGNGNHKGNEHDQTTNEAHLLSPYEFFLEIAIHHRVFFLLGAGRR